jgi:hypothetical protein
MMQEEITTNKKWPVRDVRFLLCDTTGNVELSTPGEQWVSTAIQCLNRAVEEHPPIIVVHFGRVPLREREALVRLTATLKRNSYTQKSAVLALLDARHRKLIEDLARARVDYVRFTGNPDLDSTLLRDIIKELGPDDRLERHLAVLCPFLHYDVIDSEHEMTVCGAYLDRMVLGGRRLHEICETEDHLHCEYYLNPRLES